MQRFVAKTLFYSTIQGIRVFIQEKVVPIIDIYSDTFLKTLAPVSQQTLSKIEPYKQQVFLDSFWLARCLLKYGEHYVQEFVEYCCDVDTNIIGDLHHGNYGYRLNGTPCLLDYSNFCM